MYRDRLGYVKFIIDISIIFPSIWMGGALLHEDGISFRSFHADFINLVHLVNRINTCVSIDSESRRQEALGVPLVLQ